MTNSTYFAVTTSNATYNSNTKMWEIDLPQWFVNSDDKNKAIEILGFYYYGALMEETNYERFTLHSPTLTDGRYHQLDHFITLSQFTTTSWSKRYPISSKPQKFIFQFRNFNQGLVLDNGIIPESQLFLIEMNLIY